MSIYDELLILLFADDDRTKKVMLVIFDFFAIMVRIVTVQKFFAQIIDKLDNLFLFPAILPLVIINGKLYPTEHGSYAFCITMYFFHRFTYLRILMKIV